MKWRKGCHWMLDIKNVGNKDYDNLSQQYAQPPCQAVQSSSLFSVPSNSPQRVPAVFQESFSVAFVFASRNAFVCICTWIKGIVKDTRTTKTPPERKQATIRTFLFQGYLAIYRFPLLDSNLPRNGLHFLGLGCLLISKLTPNQTSGFRLIYPRFLSLG